MLLSGDSGGALRWGPTQGCMRACCWTSSALNMVSPAVAPRARPAGIGCPVRWCRASCRSVAGSRTQYSISWLGSSHTSTALRVPARQRRTCYTSTTVSTGACVTACLCVCVHGVICSTSRNRPGCETLPSLHFAWLILFKWCYSGHADGHVDNIQCCSRVDATHQRHAGIECVTGRS